ncbi:hypothetical protein PoB_000773200 [Plakobranchus ocellatus]|uniref:Uncharacterized protein n=1 Tax=Plakobranchus ocellatus TaxID=259542 RepID=A0AAV3YEC9_9GAST|nr:hypothetical protein PoB_000773200 [Plakobranchus ocellatus]
MRDGLGCDTAKGKQSTIYPCRHRSYRSYRRPDRALTCLYTPHNAFLVFGKAAYSPVSIHGTETHWARGLNKVKKLSSENHADLADNQASSLRHEGLCRSQGRYANPWATQAAERKRGKKEEVEEEEKEEKEKEEEEEKEEE